jgi:hypothetical protein
MRPWVARRYLFRSYLPVRDCCSPWRVFCAMAHSHLLATSAQQIYEFIIGHRPRIVRRGLNTFM